MPQTARTAHVHDALFRSSAVKGAKMVNDLQTVLTTANTRPIMRVGVSMTT